MDDLVPSDTKKSDGKAASGGFGNALARFKQMDDCGRTASQLNGQSLDVAAGHKNTVKYTLPVPTLPLIHPLFY